MKKTKKTISMLVAVVFLLSILATINASAAGVPGGYIVSRNSDYSTQDTTFYTTDTLYGKVWSTYIDTTNMKTQILELKDTIKYKETYQLTTIEEDGITKFIGSCDTLENFVTGTESIEVKLKIEDNDRNKYEIKFKIDLLESSGNELPTAFIDSISPNPADLGVTVYFSGHGVDTDGTIVAYDWSSDIDGVLSTEASFSTSTLSGGTHTISFKVQDDALDWSTPVTDSLEITEPNYPPTAPTSISPDSIYDLTPLIAWSGATDPNAGDTLYYEIQIGTVSGGSDILAWYGTGTDEFYQASLDASLYYVQVKAYDGEFYSDVLEETLEVLEDTTPPVISDVSAVAGTDTATITWTTDETANSVVDFGLSSDNLDQTESNPDFITDHSIVLSGLTIATTYYYQVSSTDASGNGPTTSDILSFTTTEEITNQGWILSKNSDYSTNDTTFAWGETIYMKIWSIYVDSNNMRKQEYELKDSAGDRQKGNLIADDSGSITVFVNSVPASALALGDGTAKMKLEDNNRSKYEKRDLPITIVEVQDTDPPVITDGPYSSPGSTSAIITWTTDEDADSVVDYGLSETVLDQTESDSSYVTSHSITLTGLTALTTYYYQVSSTDDDGNGPTYSAVFNFTTTEITLDDWTYIVYQCGDNDLASQSDVDLNEMKSVGSTDSVNVLTLQDKDKGDDTKAYYVENNNLVSIPLSDIDSSWNNEVNMGDPYTLTAWVTYCINTYPADHYAVTLWDHGYGWEGICWDDSSGSDPLELAEMESALSGLGLDVVCLDACLMGMASVTYQMIGECDYLVSSEESVPWDGYPYDGILDELTLNPTMTPANLAIMTVNEYEAFYNYADWETLSAVDMSLMDEVADAVDTFALEMIDGMSQWKSKYNEAKNDADYYDEGIDLYDFARLVKQKVSDPDIENAAQGVMDAVTNAVTANYYGPWHWNTNGISIYYGTQSGYSSTKFCQDTNWDEYLDSL